MVLVGDERALPGHDEGAVLGLAEVEQRHRVDADAGVAAVGGLAANGYVLQGKFLPCVLDNLRGERLKIP